jgi:amino-acid N-acetyltransferase
VSAESSSSGRFVRARSQHRDQILALLDGAGLPVEDVPHDLHSYRVWMDGDSVGGCCGLEQPGNDVGLLRSLAVAPHLRGQGLGRALLELVVADARERSVRELFLLTTTAAAYFTSLGFQVVPRTDVPEPVRRTSEFTTTCPSSAVVMRRGI